MKVDKSKKRMCPGTIDTKGRYWEVAMTWEEGELLDSYLTKETEMLEWGCGGSTLKFSEKVKSYDSIEHNLEWYNKLKPILPTNVSLYHVPMNSPNLRDTKLDKSSINVLSPCIKKDPQCYVKDNIVFKNTRSGHDWHQYINYINFPKTLNKTYDIILIDGRARVNCAYKALSLLKENGKVIFHDFSGTREEGGRWYYQGVLYYYNTIESKRSLAILEPKIKNKND
jgi:hypothetical protein